MRLHPPETEQEEFTEQKFTEYVWQHKVLGLREEKTFKEFVADLFSTRDEKQKSVVIEQLLTLWPRVYQNFVKKILNEFDH